MRFMVHIWGGCRPAEVKKMAKSIADGTALVNASDVAVDIFKSVESAEAIDEVLPGARAVLGSINWG